MVEPAPTFSREKIFLTNILTTKWQLARKNRKQLAKILLQLAEFSSMDNFLAAIGPQTTVITIVGGAATRWDKSFDDPIGKEVADKFGIQRGRSRFLAPVENLQSENPPTVPILTYNLEGVKSLLKDPQGKPRAKHILIYSKDEEVEEIRAILQQNGLTQTQLFKQEIRPGKVKPSGHADALLQHLDKIITTPFVITQFGCDVTSPRTLHLSLLCLYVLQKLGESIDVILPTAKMDKPKYPVFIDQQGIPRQFGHEKLLGKDSLHSDKPVLSEGGSNIGVRAYTAKGLQEVFAALAPQFANAEEFALDHVDQYFADKGSIRQLCIALPEEISHAAKMLTEIPAFLENQKIVMEDNHLL